MDQGILLENLRTAVRRYDIPDQAPVPNPAQLRLDLDHAINLREQADLAVLLRTLPDLPTCRCGFTCRPPTCAPSCCVPVTPPLSAPTGESPLAGRFQAPQARMPSPTSPGVIRVRSLMLCQSPTCCAFRRASGRRARRVSPRAPAEPLVQERPWTMTRRSRRPALTGTLSTLRSLNTVGTTRREHRPHAERVGRAESGA